MTLGKALRVCLASSFVKWGCPIYLQVMFANMTSSHMTKECFFMTLPSWPCHLNDGITAFRAGSHQGQGKNTADGTRQRRELYKTVGVRTAPEEANFMLCEFYFNTKWLILWYVNFTSIQIK